MNLQKRVGIIRDKHSRLHSVVTRSDEKKRDLLQDINAARGRIDQLEQERLARLSSYLKGDSETFEDGPRLLDIINMKLEVNKHADLLCIAEIASASYGGANSSPGGSYGGGTPTSPVVTQPIGQSTQQPQQVINIVVKADAFYGDQQVAERWVEDVFAPTIKQAIGRNVDFGFPSK